MQNALRIAGAGAFLGALGLGCLAVVELALQFLGKSLTGHAYSAGRLFEFAAIAMIFAIGIQLREQATDRR